MESSTGKKIQEERKRCKMTQEDLAKAIGVKQQTICAYENGKMKPKLERLIVISAALNIPVELFLPDELNENEMVRKIKEEYDRGYQAGREAMKREIMEHMKKMVGKGVTLDAGFSLQELQETLYRLSRDVWRVFACTNRKRP